MDKNIKKAFLEQKKISVFNVPYDLPGFHMTCPILPASQRRPPQQRRPRQQRRVNGGGGQVNNGGGAGNVANPCNCGRCPAPVPAPN